MVITRSGPRLYDEDNFVAACKRLVVDNLRPTRCWTKDGTLRKSLQVGLGLIHEDDAANVKVIYKQVSGVKKESLTVDIYG